MTNRIADHEQEWLELYGIAFKSAVGAPAMPGQLVMVEAGQIVERWGWDELKASMIYCGKRNLQWRSVVSYFDIKKAAAEDMKKRVEASGHNFDDAKA